MKLFVVLVIAVFGLVIGSFLNAVIHRLWSKQSILEKHSRCPRCRHELKASDLVPLVSFFVLGGRCRYCKKSISWQYPLVELATAVAFSLIYLRWGISLNSCFLLLASCFLLIIFVYDFKHQLILDKVV